MQGISPAFAKIVSFTSGGYLRLFIMENDITKIEIYRVCLDNLVMIGCFSRKERDK